MHSTFFIRMLFVAFAAANTTASATLLNRQNCDEGSKRVCYGKDGGQSQSLDRADIEYVASYLRFVGDSNTGANARWTMPASGACEEWAIAVPDAGTVLALAKHSKPDVSTSILYADIAATIDAIGGLLECQSNGGQMPTMVNKTNPAYTSAEYKATKATPDGITIKLVRDPKFSG
ncbi:hypothetical protein J4E86_006886 [Alternaria arbusti]|uniref:uncharacterized protein n=1 Tax=Alternaria arbusti TaxID=232088 RepID=UPI00222121B8|nr:uncharacterized protein J4E86_006886 [Alternaria arbusti]KAI4953344.1 hypothetical protein J4E86_006886 [Alternaria arbusti]